MTLDVTITEVGLRDGLQNQAKYLPTELKMEIGKGLIKAGIQTPKILDYKEYK